MVDIGAVSSSAATLSVSYWSSAGAGIASILEKCLKMLALGEPKICLHATRGLSYMGLLLTEINIKH